MSDVKKTEAELSEEFFDAVYEEMMDWSNLDTIFIDNVIEFAKEDDEMYEYLYRWFSSNGPSFEGMNSERSFWEDQMYKILMKNNLA